MKKMIFPAGLLLACVIGYCAGSFVAEDRARGALLCGPYSDDLDPALQAIEAAKAKLAGGNQDVIKELDLATMHIEKVITWTQNFLDHQAASSDRAQPAPSHPPALGK